jgi:hypothetical protein
MLCFQGLDATQPVDKFNGYRGLHSMAAALPDAGYSSRPEEFFEEVAVWSLEVYGDLTPLMLELKGEISAKMSSWIPDWSAKPAVQINYWRWRIHFYRAYTCSTGIDRPFEYRAPGILLVHGFEAETVVSVAPITFELFNVGCAADPGRPCNDRPQAVCTKSLSGRFCSMAVRYGGDGAFNSCWAVPHTFDRISCGCSSRQGPI